MDLIGKKFLFNNEIFSCDDFLKVYSRSSKNVYEVVRVVNSEILFWNDHYNRLINSILKFSGKNLNNIDFKDKVYLVVSKNEIINGNIKIEIIFKDNGEYDVYIYPIKFYYPDEKIGVEVITANFERRNPSIKTYDYDFKNLAQKLIDKNNVYEIILVNRDGFITEGSRTNVYFVKGNEFFTAPENLVLNGVTRINVNNIISTLGFKLVEESVRNDCIDEFDGCFLTSTSSNVLPVNKINDIYMKSCENFYISQVMNRFKEFLKK